MDIGRCCDSDRLPPRRVNGVDIDAQEVDLDVAGCWVFKLNRGPADVDRVPVGREVAEDRGPFAGAATGRRAARGESSA